MKYFGNSRVLNAINAQPCLDVRSMRCNLIYLFRK